MGTGLGVVGLQFSGQISLEKVQQAAKELGSKFPLLLARVVGQGKAGGPLELHLCRDPKPITVATRSIDDVAAWEAAAPLDNDPSSLELKEDSDVAKKDQGSDVYADARAPADSGKGEGSTSAAEAVFEKFSAANVADERGEEHDEEEDAFEDAEDGDGDGDGGDGDGDGGDGDGDGDGGDGDGGGGGGNGDNGGGEFLEASATEGSGGIKVTGKFKGVEKAEDLHRIVEMELNQPITAAHGKAPADALQIHVYHLPRATCLALRCHRAVLDRPAVRQLAMALVSALHRSQPAVTADSPEHSEAVSLPPPLSSLTPKPPETRSYLTKSLSQAYDALGYVRNAMASSHAPFQPGRADFRTNRFRSSFACLRFSKQETERLLAALASRSCSLFSLECAAALKAVADAKQLGSRTETFNVTSIMNCRPLLDPPLAPDAMGVFTSGLPLKQPANQDLPLWDVARTVDADLAASVGQKKQFTDMPVLELLFSTAMRTPTFSPECSLRTSFMSAITESPFPMDWPANEEEGHADGASGGGDEGLVPQLEGFVGPIFATHGVGPSISVGDAICDGELHVYINFVSPLFSLDFIAGFHNAGPVQPIIRFCSPRQHRPSRPPLGFPFWSLKNRNEPLVWSAMASIAAASASLSSLQIASKATVRARSIATELSCARGFGCESVHVSACGSEFARGDALLGGCAQEIEQNSSVVVMAVPKKGTSRTKTKIRRAVWKAQARGEALKALSLAKSVLTGRSKSFIYVQNEKKSADEEGTDEAASEKNRKKRGHVSAGHGRIGKHRKHPGGRGNAGGMHHHRIMMDKYHPGYFGKVGMRYFHKSMNKFHCPHINLNELWSLIPADVKEKASGAGSAPVLDVTKFGFFKVLGAGELPPQPLILTARRQAVFCRQLILAGSG
ncbi:unnamed protein product [Closterium sp. Yama58-4]|nr:unnamed protein product [Closterium sp. Yama58-4]